MTTGSIPAKKVLLLVGFLLLFRPMAGMAMSPGHFLALFPDKPEESRFFFSTEANRQKNEFNEQRERRPEIDEQGEERHYSEIRESELTFSHAGIKTGAAVKSLPLIYLTAGYGKADINFSFTDELTGQKDEYTNQLSVDSESFPVFGGGIAARFIRKPVFENNFLEAGMDLQYRHLDFEAEDGAIQYESTLHEIQLSLAASIERVQWHLFSLIPLDFSPYGGAKISHFIGDESYSDTANTDDEGNPDPIFYTGDIDPGNHITFFAGAGFKLTRSFLITIETRFGDDDGYAANLTARF